MASFVGFGSALAGGILSDRYRDKSHYVKAIICICSSLFAAPFMILSLILQHNFWLSLGLLGGNYLIAEAWGSPAITMLQTVTNPKNMGFSISAYLFFTTMAGMIATWSLHNL